MWDSLILMVMALVVFGPRRLPEIGRKVGKIMYEVRKASNDFKFQMEDELRKAEDEDRQKKQQALAAAAPAVVDSPLANAEAEAPIGSLESPYPGESVYPAVAPSEYGQEEAYPRIHPPTTGEPVAAARPGRVRKQAETPAPVVKKPARAKSQPAASKATAVTTKAAAKTAPAKKVVATKASAKPTPAKSRKKPESAHG